MKKVPTQTVLKVAIKNFISIRLWLEVRSYDHGDS